MIRVLRGLHMTAAAVILSVVLLCLLAKWCIKVAYERIDER
jgi:uncharacterized membrane protein